MGAIDVLSWIALFGGAFFSILGAVGLLRMPDFWTRCHAAGVTDTLGAGLILLGLFFQAETALVAIKLAMILGFLRIAGPTAGHALYRAAHAHGVPFGPETEVLAANPATASPGSLEGEHGSD